MAVITVAKLLRQYSLSKQNALVDFAPFVAFTEQYARAHIGEQPELISYLLIASTQKLHDDIADLEKRKRVFFLGPSPDTRILVVDFLVASISSLYKQMTKSRSGPFPGLSDLPRYVPPMVVEPHEAPGVFSDLIEKTNITKNTLYSIKWKENVPDILFPTNISAATLLKIALEKIKLLLEDEKLKDYFLKRLIVSAAGGETTAQSFFAQIVSDPVGSFERLKENSEFFFFWMQFCSFIKQMYVTAPTMTAKDTAYLQSAYVIEDFAAYYKKSAEQKAHRDNALHTLQSLLKKPPFIFSYEMIRHFTDPFGIALINQYSEDELQKFLFTATLPNGRSAPMLFEIEIENGIQYYILKQNVLPLIQRFRNEAREVIRQKLIEEYTIAIRQFSQSKLKKEAHLFDDKLEQELKKNYQILYGLLNNKFLLQLFNEELQERPDIAKKMRIMENDRLLPCSAVLSISQDDIAKEANSQVSFWFRVSFFRPFIFLFFQISKFVNRRLDKQQAKLSDKPAKVTEPPPEILFDEPPDWKDEFRDSLVKIEDLLVPYGSTLEKELELYESRWNKQTNPAAHTQLTKKVNSAVEEYVQQTMKMANRTSFDQTRIKRIADSVMQVSGMSKIDQDDDLSMYIQYYVIFLLKSIK
jgi:hypothetical protein